MAKRIAEGVQLHANSRQIFAVARPGRRQGDGAGDDPMPLGALGTVAESATTPMPLGALGTVGVVEGVARREALWACPVHGTGAPSTCTVGAI